MTHPAVPACPIRSVLAARVLLPFACGYFLSYVYRVVNAVLARDFTAEMAINAADLGLLTSTYFITFAATQLPLGIWLDRYGPRRVESLLLLFAAAGALIFSRATDLTGLILGRGLIGLGVSACLMAAFTAFSHWFEPRQLPFVNGLQMAAGGMGAIFGTAPVELALGYMHWRDIFMLLAGLTTLIALSIWVIVPDSPAHRLVADRKDGLAGIRRILSSRTFWVLAPLATMSQAAHMSLYGLWIGPWLRDIAGLDRGDAALVMLMASVGMVVSYISMGSLAARLGNRGIAPTGLALTGMSLFMGVQALLIWQGPAWGRWLWIFFGIFGASGILAYPDLCQRFPAGLSGRVNTCLNVLVFVVSFVAQWGIGVILNQWPITATGGYAPAGYQVAIGLVLLTQILAIVWYACQRQHFPNRSADGVLPGISEKKCRA